MKHKSLATMLLFSMLSFGLSSCGNQTVKNPPTFVEMYLDEESAIVSQSAPMAAIGGPKKVETPNDGAVYSETDFVVAVVTNGANYDLLYSVEVTDSLLGACVNTDQSTTYHATSTIKVEADSTYTTTVELTIPASTEHDSYLSARTISLTKILFSRDTVNGTFPADIPSNSDTSLLFEVHAVNYFDGELGYQVSLNANKVDVIIRPSHSGYTEAATLAKSMLDIPATINDYPVGKIFLENLTWISTLSIIGGRDDVFIIGSYPLLSSIVISGLNHPLPEINPDYKHLSITGSFTLLGLIQISDCQGYRMFIGHDWVTQNADYVAYINGMGATPYTFPELANLLVEDSSLDIAQLGADSFHLPFPKLGNVNINSCYGGTFKIGNEYNQLNKLESVTIYEGRISTIDIGGTKAASEPSASLSMGAGIYDYVYVRGSLFGETAFPSAHIDELRIYGGTTEPSPLAALEITETEIDGVLLIQGNFPSLDHIEIESLNTAMVTIGGIGNTFAALRYITIDSLSSFRSQIGDRDAVFSILKSVSITNAVLTDDIRIGYEGSSYPQLETIEIADVIADDIKIGYVGDQFAKLETIEFRNISLAGSCDIMGITAPLLTTIVFTNFVAGVINASPTSASYVVYFSLDNMVNAPYFNPGCTTIYVGEQDPTTWEFYAAMQTLEIPVVHGTYSSF